MSNQAVATIRDAQETAASNGARPLGFVVNYDAESISILRTDLKAIFEEEGFHGYVPEEMDPVAALARAKGRKLPKGIQVDQFDSPNADTPVSYGIYRKVASHGESGDTRECGARVRLDKATGQIVALPPDGMPSNAVCLEVAEAIAAAANRLINFAETVDVTTSAKNVVLGALRGMAMRQRGGMYFLRPAEGERWQKFAAKLEKHGFVDLGFPIAIGAAQQKAALHAVKTGLEAKLADLRVRISKFDEKTRSSNVNGKLEDCESISGEAELYAEILGGWKDALLASVKECKAKCLAKLAGDDADFSFTPQAPPAPPAAPAAPPPVAPPAPASAAAAPWRAPLGAIADAWGQF